MKSMKILLVGTLLAFLATATPSGAQVQTFSWQNTQRQYLVKTPADTSGSHPIVFFLHGLGDNISRLDNEFHFQQIADRYRWIMVVPQALSQGGSTMWNAGLTNSSIDDVGFLMALLDTLAAHHPVDLDSVFFTGFSMGGFMTHRIAIERGDRLNACAPVSGLITHAMAACTPVAPVKMLHIHGTADPVVGYDGGSQYFGNLGLGVEAILDYWADANGCSGQPQVDTLPDLQNDGLRFVRYSYGGQAPLQHLKVIGGVHTFYLNAEQNDISYFDEIHRFFTSGGGSASLDQPAREPLCLGPNPTSGRLHIQAQSESQLLVTDIYGHIVARFRVAPGRQTLDLSALPSGLYFVKELGTGATSKLVLNR